MTKKKYFLDIEEKVEKARIALEKATKQDYTKYEMLQHALVYLKHTKVK